jgi:Domain of unknown function (DUF3127)
MSYELSGKLVEVYDVVQRTETFRTREFVIEKTEDIGGRTITNYAKFQCVQDKTSLPDRFKTGDTVKVSFNIKGSKWTKEGRVNYITNLDAWRIEAIANATEYNDVQHNQPATYTDIPAAPGPDMTDDLPF